MKNANLIVDRLLEADLSAKDELMGESPLEAAMIKYGFEQEGSNYGWPVYSRSIGTVTIIVNDAPEGADLLVRVIDGDRTVWPRPLGSIFVPHSSISCFIEGALDSLKQYSGGTRAIDAGQRNCASSVAESDDFSAKDELMRTSWIEATINDFNFEPWVDRHGETRHMWTHKKRPVSISVGYTKTKHIRVILWEKVNAPWATPPNKAYVRAVMLLPSQLYCFMQKVIAELDRDIDAEEAFLNADKECHLHLWRS